MHSSVMAVAQAEDSHTAATEFVCGIAVLLQLIVLLYIQVFISCCYL
jgi:hypothetical protein